MPRWPATCSTACPPTTRSGSEPYRYDNAAVGRARGHRRAAPGLVGDGADGAYPSRGHGREENGAADAAGGATASAGEWSPVPPGAARPETAPKLSEVSVNFPLGEG